MICEEMFDSHQYFMHHINKLHFAKGKWRCHFCKTVFGDRLDLLLHLNRSHGKSLRLDTRFASSKSAVISVIPKGTVKKKETPWKQTVSLDYHRDFLQLNCDMNAHCVRRTLAETKMHFKLISSYIVLTELLQVLP